MRMESDDENFQDTKIPSYVKMNMSITSQFSNFFLPYQSIIFLMKSITTMLP